MIKNSARQTASCLVPSGPSGRTLILIGGDIMVAKPGKASLEVTRRFLDGLCQVQTQTTGENSGKPFRIYYGNGNHEQRLGREYKTYGESTGSSAGS